MKPNYIERFRMFCMLIDMSKSQKIKQYAHKFA